jgi:3'-phosphoadenosine 5'-phosphosulfate sulfotransferase (PAPS reductase)/FAD synthetase
MNPNDFDIVVVAFSGGKDSLACLLHLLDLGVSRTKIELWHHDVDGKSETFFDWPCTESYCRAIASHFKIPIYFSWKDGGFKNELLRENEYSRKTFFETPEGLKTSGGDRGQQLTRRKFPHVGEIKKGRWCSAILKIGVAQTALCNQKRFLGKRTLFITGERAEESASRAKYQEWEEHKSHSAKREVTHWRPIHKWSELKVWQIIRHLQNRNGEG